MSAYGETYGQAGGGSGGSSGNGYPDGYRWPERSGGGPNWQGRARRRATQQDAMEGWKSYPAGCLVAFGALSIVLLLAGLTALTALLPGYRDSGTYRTAFERLIRSPEVEAAIGRPIRETGLIADVSDFDSGEGGRDRRLSLEVTGPLGGGVLFAEAREHATGTRLTRLRLRLEDGRVIVLQAPARAWDWRTRPGAERRPDRVAL